MLTQFFGVGLLMLFSAMLPGPDFAMVTKNTLLHSRRAGFFTTFGITSAVAIHVTYCILGLAIVIASSLFLFNIIKYVGAAYLIFLGIQSLRSHQVKSITEKHTHAPKSAMDNLAAFRQGFFCNLFNPKATLFFLALFTMLVKAETPVYKMALYGIEMLCICLLWFSTLTFILSHAQVTRLLENSEKYIAKLLGILLIGFGIALVFVRQSIGS